MTSRGRKFLRDMWRHFAAMSIVMAFLASLFVWLDHTRLASEAPHSPAKSRAESTFAPGLEASLEPIELRTSPR
jgi:hypothetical protein